MYDVLIDLYTWTLPFLQNTKKDYIYALDVITQILQPITKWYYFNERIGIQRESYSNITNSLVKYNV